VKQTKICKKCGVEKPISSFNTKRTVCKLCHAEKCRQYDLEHREARIAYLRKYKKEHPEANRIRCRQWYRKNRIKSLLRASKQAATKRGYMPCSATIDEVAKLQTGYCYACGVSEEEFSRPLCLDHNHRTGKVRGWLCHDCNTALGYTHDSKEKLAQLIAYLVKYSDESTNN